MKKMRFLVLVLIAVLLFGGCAGQPEEEFEVGGGGALVTAPSETPKDAPTDTPDETPEQTPEETPEETPEQTPESTPEQPSEQTPEQPSEPEKEEENDVNEPIPGMVDLATDVRFFGRTYEEAGTYYINWTESGFEFNFNGTGAEATFESNAPGGAHTAYIRIYVDGKEPGQTVAITESMQTVTLCSGLKKGSHTVRVIKRTNARSSSLGVTDITLLKNGVIEAPSAAYDRRIEFVGDSLTVGYGTQGNSSTAEWSTATEDGSVTYAALTAKALKAEYNVIAVSGRGLAHNTGGDTDKLMPSLYPMLDQYNNPGVEWDFSKFVPHVIVINLGTNDHHTSTEDEVTAATTAFLKDVRKHNPDAHIIFAYEFSGNKMASAIKKAVSAVGDSKITYLALPTATEKVLGHPAKSAHQAAAKVLTAEIQKVTGWK